MAGIRKDEASFIASGIVLGDQFDCIDEVDRALTGSSLESAGFTFDTDGLRLTITGVPEDEYLVQAYGRSVQKVYCGTLEEALGAMEDIRSTGIYEHIEILKGYQGGHWDLVKEAWR